MFARLILQDRFWLCIYNLFVRSEFNFLFSFFLTTFPTQSYLVIYSLCASLLHSLNMWSTVSSLSSKSTSEIMLHLIYFYFDMIGPYDVVLVLLLEEIQFLSKGFSFSASSTYLPCVMSLVNRLIHPVSCLSFHVCFQVISVLLILVLSVLLWWLWSVFLCACLCSLRVIVSMRQWCLQCWQVPFLPLFLRHIVCQCHL